jgi:hypothetical protein
VGGVGTVQGVEGKVNGQRAELGTALVSFRPRRFDHDEVPARHHGQQKLARGIGVNDATDKPEDRRAAEAAVVESHVGRKRDFGLAKAGAAAEREHGAEANKHGRRPIDFSRAKLGPVASCRVAGQQAAERYGPERFPALREKGLGAVLHNEGFGCI